MNTYLIVVSSCFAGLIKMTWLHSIKTRHEQQKEPNYLKNKPFSKSSNFFWNACKELSKKTKQKKNKKKNVKKKS